MERFLTEYKKNKIFIHVPTKKYYLSNLGLFRDQSAQKGGTCWYYVLNYLRIRYGKDFPNQDYPYRRIERILSLFRNNIVKIENITSKFLASLESLQFEYQKEEIDKIIAEKRLNINQELSLKSEDPFKEEEIQLLKNFLNQFEFNELSLYINNIILLKYITNARHCLEELGINSNHALQEHIKEHANFEFDNLTISDEYIIFQNLIYLEAVKQYHLKISTWNPCYKIEHLIEHLNKEGPLAVSGYFQFKEDFLPSLESNKIGIRPLYYLEELTIEYGDIGHAVLIIGAEINDSGEWVFYLDPNDSTGTSKVYKIPYHYLNKVIADIYGYPFSEADQTKNIPFAVCTDNNWIQKEENLILKL
ncbi:hypothetical protein ACQUW5_13210 [Legionella sp. CNM-1927-20]|uniref:hypothetical protein n=1 Tax=Legionella sp. CNM-1927-20 TaxID=3422221 RepID=UPI00403AC267